MAEAPDRRPQFPRPFCAILLAALVCLLTGCESSSEPKGKVAGKVTYKNAPVTGLTIHFVNAEGAFVAAKLDNDGTYLLRDAPLGTVQVYFSQSSGPMMNAKTQPPKGVQPIDATEAPAPQTKIPVKYLNKDSSRLSYEVKRGGNAIDIELQ